MVVALLVLLAGPPLIWIALKGRQGRRLAVVALVGLVVLSGFLVKRSLEVNADEAARASDEAIARAFGVNSVIPVSPLTAGAAGTTVPLRGYVADGRTLLVGYTHNPLCSLVRAAARESADRVMITVMDAPIRGSADCRAVPSVAEKTVWLVTLTLADDLADRTVIDAATDQPVTRKMVEK
ncbi:hypothetical protein J5X84_19695 [Streptosporangiaceae bacterium NEAU-GS5]|nr:hypothetical protein [Streptosporangiaceae bacterium NEAU-GS5]